MEAVFLNAFFPRPLPHRFLLRPRFVFRAAVSLTFANHKRKKTHTKKPLARDIEKSHARVARERRRGSKVQGTRDVGCLEIFIPGSCK